MKKLNSLLSMACVLFFASCASDTEDFNAEGNTPSAEKTITIGVELPGDDGTRVAFNNDITKMVWKSGDRLTLVGYGADGKYKSYNMSSVLKNGENTSKATFEAALNMSWSKYEFAYLGSMVSVNENDKDNPYLMRFDNQVQNGAGSVDHVKDYLLLKSDKYKMSVLSTDNKACTLKPVTSVMRLNVKNLPEDMKGAASYNFKYYINYESSMQLCNAELKYNGTITNGSNNYIYMAFNPMNGVLKANNKIAFEVSTGAHKAIAYATATIDKTYEGGKVYTATLDYKDQSNLTWESSGDDNIVYAAPAKRSPVFAIEFTGQRCMYCPNLSRALQGSQDKYGADNYIISALHNLKSFSYELGNNVKLYSEEAERYGKIMDVPIGLPHVYYNSLGVKVDDTPLDDMFKLPDLLECKLDVQITADKKYQISVATHLRSDRKQFIENKNIDILLWSLEDGIVAIQNDNGNWTYPAHKHIFRGSINGFDGVPYKIGTTYKGTFDIPAAVSVAENTDIVVFILDHDTRSILDGSHFKIGVSKAGFK